MVKIFRLFENEITFSCAEFNDASISDKGSASRVDRSVSAELLSPPNGIIGINKRNLFVNHYHQERGNSDILVSA